MANAYASIAHLDRQVTNTSSGVTSSYDSGTGTTTWTIPYNVPTDQMTGGQLTIGRSDTNVWLQDSKQAVNSGVTVTRPATNQIAVTGLGDMTAVAVLIGLLYNASYELSTIYMRNQRGGAETRGRTRLGYLSITYAPMTDMTVMFTPQGRPPYTYVFYDPTAQNDNPEIFPYRVPLQGRNEDALIVVSNNTPGSTRMVNFDWEGDLTIRSRGV